MIVFDLECRAAAHRFEGWFGSSDDFADQQGRGLVTCPICGSADVAKAISAPNLARKGNQRQDLARRPTTTEPAPPAPPPLPPEAIAALQTIARIQAETLKTSTWVGKNFADDARAMHYGEKDAAPIHGQTSPAEAKALIEEGVSIAPILFPVAPPEDLN